MQPPRQSIGERAGQFGNCQMTGNRVSNSSLERGLAMAGDREPDD